MFVSHEKTSPSIFQVILTNLTNTVHINDKNYIRQNVVGITKT